MPRQKPDKVIAKAVRLLGEGKSQSEVAKKCGVSVRTLQRWVSSEGVGDKNIQKQSDQLVVAANKTIQTVLADSAVQQQLEDLAQYRNGQRLLAIEMASLASRLSIICTKSIERLELNPEDLAPRILPQYLKALSELSSKASDCWARSLGLDSILENLEHEPKAVAVRSEEV